MKSFPQATQVDSNTTVLLRGTRLIGVPTTHFLIGGILGKILKWAFPPCRHLHRISYGVGTFTPTLNETCPQSAHEFFVSQFHVDLPRLERLYWRESGHVACGSALATAA